MTFVRRKGENYMPPGFFDRFPSRVGRARTINSTERERERNPFERASHFENSNSRWKYTSAAAAAGRYILYNARNTLAFLAPRDQKLLSHIDAFHVS